MVYVSRIDEVVDSMMAQFDAEEMGDFDFENEEAPWLEEDFYQDYLNEMYW